MAGPWHHTHPGATITPRKRWRHEQCSSKYPCRGSSTAPSRHRTSGSLPRHLQSCLAAPSRTGWPRPIGRRASLPARSAEPARDPRAPRSPAHRLRAHGLVPHRPGLGHSGQDRHRGRGPRPHHRERPHQSHPTPGAQRGPAHPRQRRRPRTSRPAPGRAGPHHRPGRQSQPGGDP